MGRGQCGGVHTVKQRRAKDAAATSDPKTQELKKLTSDRSLHGGVIASESVRGGGEDGREGP